MMAIRFIGQTIVLGAPENWDPEQNGECFGLPVRREVVDGMPYLTSYWLPTPEELEALANGAHVRVSLIGVSQPPINIGVEKAEQTAVAGETT